MKNEVKKVNFEDIKVGESFSVFDKALQERID
jgi:hypothetical protein